MKAHRDVCVVSPGIFHPFRSPSCMWNCRPWATRRLLGFPGREDIWNLVFSRLAAIKCVVRSPSRRSLQFYLRDNNKSDDTRYVHTRGCGCGCGRGCGKKIFLPSLILLFSFVRFFICLFVALAILDTVEGETTRDSEGSVTTLTMISIFNRFFLIPHSLLSFLRMLFRLFRNIILFSNWP